MTWRRLLYVFVALLPLCICLTFPLQAQAFELTTEVKATGRSWKPTQVRCRYHDGQVVVRDSVSCPVVNNAWLVQMEMLNPRVDFKEGLYYRTTMSFQWHTLSIGRELLWTPYTIDFFTLVNLVQTVNQDSTGTSNAQSMPFTNIFDITLRANGTEGQGVFSFGDGTNAFAVVLPATNTAEGSVAMGTIYEYEVSGINQEQQQATQDASDNSQTTSESSSQDAGTQSQTLLEAFTGFVGAIVGASPTNCTINGNLGKIDMGQLNFCKDSPPPVIQTIGSIIAIAIIVPLSYFTVKRMLSTIRSFQT